MAKISAARVPAFRNHRAAAKRVSSREAVARSQQISACDFPLRPLQVTWEITQSCYRKGASGRVAARLRNKQQLSTAEAFHVVDEVAAMHIPLLAVTGGDPLARGDLLPVLQYASSHSVRTSLTLLPTPLLTRDAISDLKDCGLMRAAFWLHGSTAALHDPCFAPGAYRHTLEAIGWCHEVQLPVQVNTTVVRRNLHDLNSAIELLSRLDIVLWNVFFFVPPSRDQAGELLTAEEHEEVFAKLYAASGRVRFQIKTTEGQHYQRFLLQKRARESRGRMTEAESITCAPRGVNDGKALVFINHAGEVYPSRFLPLSCGNIKVEPLSRIYCDSPLFVSLRDSSQLKGKCGRCSVHNVCGGSRARAYGLTGDVFAEEPCCAYQPEVPAK
jgi:radical SAM protein with 4Fe4S-binding SPASM domain